MKTDKILINSSQKRNSSFELLRILLMVMIVIHHCIVHGFGFAGISIQFDVTNVIPTSQVPIAFVVNALCICAVNCFILISGYFRINPTSTKYINLIFSLFFYAFILTVIPYCMEEKWHKALMYTLFLSHNTYWFVVDYLFLMVFSPVLNLALEKLSVIKRRTFLVGLVIISCYFGFVWNHRANTNGYTILQFIFVYCLGREIYFTNLRASKIKGFITYIIACTITGLIGYVLYYYGYKEWAWRTTAYNNPLIIIAAIGLFLVFKNITLHSSLINRLAQSAFGIYLFQESYFIGSRMYGYLAAKTEMTYEIWGVILFTTLVVSVVAIIFDQIRIWMLPLFQTKIRSLIKLK